VNNVLKQRLVGALILIALGVVFWPIIFVEQGAGPAPERSAIPPRPVVDNSPIEPPDSIGLRSSPPLEDVVEEEGEAAVADDGVTAVTGPEQGGGEVGEPREPVAVVEPAAVPPPPDASGETGRRTREAPPVTPERDSDGVPIAWILQVVTLSNEQRAEQLRQELLDMGEKAYVRKVRRDERTLYRVYIGPGFEKARIEALKPRIDQRFGVESVVRRYLP
jgi:DedD protein